MDLAMFLDKLDENTTFDLVGGGWSLRLPFSVPC